MDIRPLRPSIGSTRGLPPGFVPSSAVSEETIRPRESSILPPPPDEPPSPRPSSPPSSTAFPPSPLREPFELTPASPNSTRLTAPFALTPDVDRTFKLLLSNQTTLSQLQADLKLELQEALERKDNTKRALQNEKLSSSDKQDLELQLQEGREKLEQVIKRERLLHGTQASAGEMRVFENMRKLCPKNQFVEELYQSALNTPNTKEGESDRLQLLIAQLKPACNHKCLCHLSKGSHRCRSLFLAAFFQAEGPACIELYLHDEVLAKQACLIAAVFLPQAQDLALSCKGALDKLPKNSPWRAMRLMPFSCLLNARAPLTAPLVELLFRLLTNNVDTDVVSVPRNHEPMSTIGQTIDNNFVLPLIFHHIGLPTVDPQVKQMALDMLILLFTKPGNAELLSLWPDWQCWILPIVMTSTVVQEPLVSCMDCEMLHLVSGEGPFSSKGVSREVYVRGVLVATSVHLEDMKKVRQDQSREACPMWLLLEAFARRRWDSGEVQLARDCFSALLKKIASNAAEFTSLFDYEAAAGWAENVFTLIETLLEFVFFRPVEKQLEEFVVKPRKRTLQDVAAAVCSRSAREELKGALAASGLHIRDEDEEGSEEDMLCLDLGLLQKTLDTLHALRLDQETLNELQGTSPSEKKLRQRGAEYARYLASLVALMELMCAPGSVKTTMAPSGLPVLEELEQCRQHKTKGQFQRKLSRPKPMTRHQAHFKQIVSKGLQLTARAPCGRSSGITGQGPSSLYSGVMKKKSTINRHMWQSRYFVLTPCSLEYYNDEATYKKATAAMKDPSRANLLVSGLDSGEFKDDEVTAGTPTGDKDKSSKLKMLWDTARNATLAKADKEAKMRSISLSIIQAVISPRQGKGSEEGCRLNLNLHSAAHQGVFELMAANREECQAWESHINAALKVFEHTDDKGSGSMCMTSEFPIMS